MRQPNKEELDAIFELDAKMAELNLEAERKMQAIRVACAVPPGAQIDRYTGKWGKVQQGPSGQELIPFEVK